MKILDRYILKSFWGMFLGSLVTVSFLFTVISILDSLNYLMGREGADFYSLLRYYALQLPQTVYMGAPVAALLSTMIVLGAMNQNNELMAFRAGGVSLSRITVPILASTLVIGALLFVLGNTLVPVGNRLFLSAKQDIKGEEPDPARRIWYVSEGEDKRPRILRIERVDRHSGDLSGVTVYYAGRKLGLKEQVAAARADFDPESGWTAIDAVRRTFPRKGFPKMKKVDKTPLELPDTAADLLRIQRAPEEMTLFSLIDQIDRVQRHGLPKTVYRVELQTRFSIPLAALLLVLVGAPFAIRPVRTSGIAISILGAIIIGFAYFVIVALFISLGKGGMVPAWAAAWSANMIFGVVGALLYSGIRK